MSKMKYVWLALVMLYLMLATACVIDDGVAYQSSGKDRTIIRRGVIENMTEVILKEVEVLHLPTNVITSVSAVLPNTRAEIGFQPTQLRADSAVLRWTERGRQIEVQLEVPQVAQEGKKGSLTLVYRIFSGGRVTVQIEQNSGEDRQLSLELN